MISASRCLWLEYGDHHKLEEWIWTVNDRNALGLTTPLQNHSTTVE